MGTLDEEIQGQDGAGLSDGAGSSSSSSETSGAGTPDPIAELRARNDLLEARLGEMARGQQALLEAVTRGREPERVAPAGPVINPDEIEELVARGQTKEAVERVVEAALTRFRDTEIRPLVQTSTSHIAGLQREMRLAQLPDAIKPFAGEIEKTLAALPGEAQLNPMAQEVAVGLVMRNNFDKIVERAVETRLRQGGRRNFPSPGYSGGRGSQGTELGPEDYVLDGQDMRAAFAELGTTPDLMAARRGYGNWGGFLEVTKGRA